MRGQFRERWNPDLSVCTARSVMPEIAASRPRTGNKLGGLNRRPEEALAAGFRFAIIAPKGHAVSFHLDERTARIGMYTLRHMGCSVKPIESLLT